MGSHVVWYTPLSIKGVWRSFRFGDHYTVAQLPPLEVLTNRPIVVGNDSTDACDSLHASLAVWYDR